MDQSHLLSLSLRSRTLVDKSILLSLLFRSRQLVYGFFLLSLSLRSRLLVDQSLLLALIETLISRRPIVSAPQAWLEKISFCFSMGAHLPLNGCPVDHRQKTPLYLRYKRLHTGVVFEKSRTLDSSNTPTLY